jgi:anti-sigma B factor antagonist
VNGRAPDEGWRLSDKDAIATAVDNEDGIAVLTVGGEVDLATVPALEAAIDEALATQPTALIVDLSDVEFLASAGLQTLVTTQDKLGTSTQFAVVAHGAATSRPIQLTGLDEIFELYATRAEAVTAVKARRP